MIKFQYTYGSRVQDYDKLKRIMTIIMVYIPLE